MTLKILPFLMFTGRAEEAIGFYRSLFPQAEAKIDRYAAGESGVEGAVKQATLAIGGQTLMFTDSPPVHDFTFTPSLSLFVHCEDDAEIERLFAAFGEEGQILMPLGAYGFSKRFGWVNDRFGVSWQLNLA